MAAKRNREWRQSKVHLLTIQVICAAIEADEIGGDGLAEFR